MSIFFSILKIKKMIRYDFSVGTTYWYYIEATCGVVLNCKTEKQTSNPAHCYHATHTLKVHFKTTNPPDHF